MSKHGSENIKHATVFLPDFKVTCLFPIFMFYYYLLKAKLTFVIENCHVLRKIAVVPWLI